MTHIYPRGEFGEPWRSLDIEANWFAAGFLMPEKPFLALHNQGWTDAMLGEHFDVSERLVEIRRGGLDLEENIG
jgi:Zn-dependent peptidase ImmA (M78 family)